MAAIQEQYRATYCGVNSTTVIASGTNAQAQMGGFFCTIAGSAKIAKAADGTGSVIVNTFAVVAGVFYPVPMSISEACALVLTGGAEGTLFTNPGQS
jgi:hypothetical protein